MYRVQMYLFARQFSEETAVILPRKEDLELRMVDRKPVAESDPAAAPTQQALLEARLETPLSVFFCRC
jgi:hypothetical protein